MLCLGLKKSLSSLRLKLKPQGMGQITDAQSWVWYHSAIQAPLKHFQTEHRSGRGGVQVVSELAFYSDGTEFESSCSIQFYWIKFAKNNEISLKKAGNGRSKQLSVVSDKQQMFLNGKKIFTVDGAGDVFRSVCLWISFLFLSSTEWKSNKWDDDEQ